MKDYEKQKERVFFLTVAENSQGEWLGSALTPGIFNLFGPIPRV
jgi:hypothetical protein